MDEETSDAGSTMMKIERAALEAAAKKALALRRASNEICTYNLDGWVVQEHPDERIERLAPVGRFRAEDFPYPGFTLPKR